MNYYSRLCIAFIETQKMVNPITISWYAEGSWALLSILEFWPAFAVSVLRPHPHLRL